MGQYFLLVNQDKKQYVCPWCLGGGAKLWEWAANHQAGIFPLLLRQSTASGGGDWYGYGLGYDEGTCLGCDGSQTHQSPLDGVVGSWAGDRVTLVGDYDDSNLFDLARQQYTNISRDIGRAFNQFVDVEPYRLQLQRCDGCRKFGQP